MSELSPNPSMRIADRLGTGKETDPRIARMFPRIHQDLPGHLISTKPERKTETVNIPKSGNSSEGVYSVWMNLRLGKQGVEADEAQARAEGRRQEGKLSIGTDARDPNRLTIDPENRDQNPSGEVGRPMLEVDDASQDLVVKLGEKNTFRFKEADFKNGSIVEIPLEGGRTSLAIEGFNPKTGEVLIAKMKTSDGLLIGIPPSGEIRDPGRISELAKKLLTKDQLMGVIRLICPFLGSPIGEQLPPDIFKPPPPYEIAAPTPTPTEITSLFPTPGSTPGIELQIPPTKTPQAITPTPEMTAPALTPTKTNTPESSLTPTALTEVPTPVPPTSTPRENPTLVPTPGLTPGKVPPEQIEPVPDKGPGPGSPNYRPPGSPGRAPVQIPGR